jgi:putative transposase
MSDSEPLSPRDQAERIALFRAELIGAVSRRALCRGQLAAALRTLAAERYLPPGSKTLRYFGVSTFERWLYSYRAHGLAGLRPSPRSDRGRGRDLTPEQRTLLLDIRREHPTASVPLILRTLVADGRLAAAWCRTPRSPGCPATPASSAA